MQTLKRCILIAWQVLAEIYPTALAQLAVAATIASPDGSIGLPSYLQLQQSINVRPSAVRQPHASA